MNKIVGKYLPILEKQYPHLRINNIQFFDGGEDHYVLVVDDKHAYRFPRGDGFGKKDIIENKFFKDFAKISPITIQEMEECVDKETGIVYQTYNFISGVGFTKEVASTFTQEEKDLLALKLGEFLKQLHSYSIKKALAIQMDSISSADDYIDFFGNRLKNLKKEVFPLLPKETQDWVERLFKTYLATSADLFIPKVTHFDMQPMHIIVDPKTHTLSGVIDFSLRIADPARDFMYFNRYGKSFLQMAYRAYGDKDRNFDRRRQFYAGGLEISEFEDAIKSEDSVGIEKMRQNLINYAKEYPVL